MIRPPLQFQPPTVSPSSSPSTLSTLLTPSIFLPILSHCPSVTLSACLRVSKSISHQGASVLYRSIHLIDILPPAIPSPPFSPSLTLIPLLGYVRTLRLPNHQLYDPALCAAVVKHMPRLERVIVPGDWEGWVVPPTIDQPAFPDVEPPSRYEKLKVNITGLRSPAAIISRGIIQSKLLEQAQEVILVLDHLNPVYRGPRQRVTAAMAGLRYSTDIPSTVIKLTILLPPEGQPHQPRRAAFDPVADSPFFSTPFGPAISIIDTSISGPLKLWEMAALDPAPDLARSIAGRSTTREITVVMRTSRVDMVIDGRESAYVSLGRLKGRTERLAQGILGEQGGEDATAADTVPVRWVLESDWEGLAELKEVLD